MSRKSILIVSMVYVLVSVVSIAWGQEKFPSRPIQIVIPYAPGGNADLSMRILGKKMAEILGQPVVVVNKPGGATAIGVSAVVKAKPDGHTILIISGGIVLITLTTPDLPYKLSDLAPIGTVVGFNYVVAVNKTLPIRNLPELVSYVRNNPNTLNYGSGAVGGNTYYIAELLKLNAKLNMQHIPYPGVRPVLTALLGNHIQIAFIPVADIRAHIKSGEIKPIVVFSEKRDPILPDVATCVEQGFPELVTPSFHLLFAPVKTPGTVLKKLEDALEKALQDREARDKIMKITVTPEFHDSKYVQNYLDRETEKWSAVLKKLNVGKK